MAGQQSVPRPLMGTNSTKSSLEGLIQKDGAAATAASKLFHCLIVFGRKLCWIKTLVSDGRIKEIRMTVPSSEVQKCETF